MKILWEHWESNPELLAEKQECSLCARDIVSKAREPPCFTFYFTIRPNVKAPKLISSSYFQSDGIELIVGSSFQRQSVILSVWCFTWKKGSRQGERECVWAYSRKKMKERERESETERERERDHTNTESNQTWPLEPQNFIDRFVFWREKTFCFLLLEGHVLFKTYQHKSYVLNRTFRFELKWKSIKVVRR